MRSVRLVDFFGCAFCSALLLPLGGCSASSPEAGPSTADGAPAQVDVVQVTTLTTVQASSGLFLSASPRRDTPDYVGRAAEPTGSLPETTLDRAEVDLALLFQARSATSLPEVRAELRAAGDGEWSAVERFFPPVEPTERGVGWPIQLLRQPDSAPTGVSSEWSGWRAFGGLGVGAPARPGLPSAAVATLDFEVRGRPSPLVLTGDVDDLVVTNQSGSAIERALLIYSHPGGVGVTLVSELGPGASAVTGLGPKEHPPERLLALAREDLRAFFVDSVGEELGAAIADAKSIPFLETPGLRLISLLRREEAPATLDAPSASTLQQVVVSHSEILKRDEEERALEVVSDTSLDALRVASELGRFSEAKLEYVASTGEETLRVRARALLRELRGP